MNTLSSKQVKSFFYHVARAIKNKNKYYKKSTKINSAPLKVNSIPDIKIELKKIAEDVEVNKFNLDLLRKSNNEIYKDFAVELDEIKEFEENVADAITKFNLKSEKDPLITTVNKNVHQLDRTVDNITKIREIKARRTQKQLDRIETLLEKIIDNYEGVLKESEKRKQRFRHIENKMTAQLSDDDVARSKLRKKLFELEEIYKRMDKGKVDPETLFELRKKIRLLKFKLKD